MLALESLHLIFLTLKLQLKWTDSLVFNSGNESSFGQQLFFKSSLFRFAIKKLREDLEKSHQEHSNPWKMSLKIRTSRCFLQQAHVLEKKGKRASSKKCWNRTSSKGSAWENGLKLALCFRDPLAIKFMISINVWALSGLNKASSLLAFTLITVPLVRIQQIQIGKR